MGSKELLSEQVFMYSQNPVLFDSHAPSHCFLHPNSAQGQIIHTRTLLLIKLFFFFQIRQSETVYPPLPVRSVAYASLYLCFFLGIRFRVFRACPWIACCPLASWGIGSVSKFFKTWGASLNYFLQARSWHKSIFTNFAESFTPP